jgi:type IV pilus assembly protein PilA
MKNQKGFSLVELLVVVIIIAIIAAIAIPSLLASRRAANEASAVQSMRTYHSAQATFQATNINRDYATTAAALLTAGLVDSVLGTNSATKSGYDLLVVGVAGTSGAATQYCASAEPDVAGTTGVNFYGVSSANGGVVVSNATSLACASGALGSAGTPVQ